MTASVGSVVAVSVAETVLGDGPVAVVGVADWTRDEPIAASRDRSDVSWRAGLITQRLAQIGDRLRHRVFGDVGARPDAVEQLFLGHELARAIDEKEQQIEQLRREIERFAGAGHPIRDAVGLEVPEAGAHGGGLCLKTTPGVVLAVSKERLPES
jgi:hypothetical protein